MQARLLSKKACPVTFSSHSCLRTQKKLRKAGYSWKEHYAWVWWPKFLQGCMQCRVWWKKEQLPGSSEQEKWFGNWPLPETTLPRFGGLRRIHSRILAWFPLCFWNMARAHLTANYSISRDIFWPCRMAYRSLVPGPGIKPTPLHWKHKS